MLLSLACWIGFTVPIGHIHPPVVSCKFYNDTTDKIYLQEPKTYDESKRKKRSLAVLTPGNVLHKFNKFYSKRRISTYFFNKKYYISDTVPELPIALPMISGNNYLDPALTLPLESLNAHHARLKRELPVGNGNAWKNAMVLNDVDGYVIGKSPQVIDFENEQKIHKIWISPRWNNEVFDKPGVRKTFFLIFLLIIVGEFFR